MRIQRFNEKLGVPSGIYETAKEVYEHIIDEVNDINFDIIDYEEESSINLTDIYIDINDISVNLDIVLDIKLNNNVDKLVMYSAGMGKTIKPIDKLGKFESKKDYTLKFNFVNPSFININNEDVIEKITIETIAHELKHLYDNYKYQDTIAANIDYSKNTERMGLKELDTLGFYLYFLTNVESLVRNVEVYSDMREKDVSKSEFLDFLTSNDTVKKLKEIQNYSIEEFYANLESQISNINKDLGPDPLNYVLKLYLNKILEFKSSEFKRYLGIYVNVNNLDHEVTDEMEKYYQKNIVPEQKYLKNPKKYFEKIFKFLKFESNKVLRKIYKLYDMAKDDKTSVKNWDIHQKINSKGDTIPETIEKFEDFKESNFTLKKTQK